MRAVIDPETDAEYLSVSDIMECYGLRRSYVYKLACNHKWRRVYDVVAGGGRPYVRYHVDDIDKVLGQDISVA